MTYPLGLRTLALLAIVAASTAVLVLPDLLGAPQAAAAALASIPAIGRN